MSEIAFRAAKKSMKRNDERFCGSKIDIGNAMIIWALFDQAKSGK